MRSDDYRKGYREGFAKARERCKAYMAQLRSSGRLLPEKRLTASEAELLAEWERQPIQQGGKRS